MGKLTNTREERSEMQKEMRFLIVVFNYGRIESLTANLEKIEDINYDIDTLLVYDCSKDSGDQLAALAEYCRQSRLKLGEDVLFRPRVNWGMAEGGRVDFATDLRETAVSHRFLLQFQDHYLDTTSSYSLWPAGMLDLDGHDISGKVKGDCIKSGHAIKLNKYARYLEDGVADVLYSSQDGIGLFPYWREIFYCIDGVNFATSIGTYLDIFDERTCISLKTAWDGTYEWVLFAEHYVGYRIMQLGLKLCDTYYDVAFKDTLDMIKELKRGKGLKAGVRLADVLHVSERYYATLFHDYMEKVQNEPA